VYATGVLLYELIAGRTPFGAAHPAAVQYRHLNAEPEPIAGAPSVLWGLIGRCLAKQPGDRPVLPELVSALRAAVPELSRDRLPSGSSPGRQVLPTHVPGRITDEQPDVSVEWAPARALVEPAEPSPGVTHLGRRGAVDPSPSAVPSKRRWPYAAAALLAIGVACGAAVWAPAGDREPVYRGDTGWVCPAREANGGAAPAVRVRPRIPARGGAVFASVGVKSPAAPAHVDLHLVRFGELPAVVASGRCWVGSARETTTECGPLRYPLDDQRYFAVAVGPGGMTVATPLVSR
jgi:hypothetical protein